MLAWGIALAAAGLVSTPAAKGPATSELRTTYRVGPTQRPTPVDRATAVIDALTGGWRLPRRGRHFDTRIGDVTFALESGRIRRLRDPFGAIGSATGRVGSARDPKEMAVALAVDWSLGDGHWRLGGGLDRLRLADAGLRRGRTGTTVLAVELDYVAPGGWTVGGGWRSVTADKRSDDRFAALALGARPAAAGGFLHGMLGLSDMTTMQVEGGVARLGEDDSRLLGGTFDRRATVTLRRAIS